MTPYEIIARKRDQHPLTREEIEYFISAFMRNEVADYQMTAMLMAIYIRGMDFQETSALTRAYLNSGVTVDLSDIPGIKVDKHSTGGVGDKVSLVLAPLVASLGVAVPMISGRGLGHSGGTLDKLESIPGFQTDLSIERFRQLLKKHHLGLIGQTRELVPADKRIYALRDVTATVDCIPLIAASIMSKKIAEGIDALVLDVKYGNGAFMKSPEKAEELARTLIKIGQIFGKDMVAVLTSMAEPLGHYVGNWLEVLESLECLRGEGPPDLMEVIIKLSSQMVLLGGAAETEPQAMEKCRAALADGRAMEKFLQVAHDQGADTSYLSHPEKYPQAKEVHTLQATRSGFVSEINTFDIGMTAVKLGAGRLRTEDRIDPQAGLIMHIKLGQAVHRGDPLVTLHTNRPGMVEPALQQIAAAISISEAPRTPPPLILKTLTA